LIKRTLARKLRQAVRDFAVVTVTGPRQSGKTTLLRAEFADYRYVSLELPDERTFALEDPRGFLAQFNGPTILDEAQRVPDLFSYIQVLVDERDRSGQFILSGSENFLLLQRISQSLAGRCAVLHLLPFSLAELLGRKGVPAESLGSVIPKRTKAPHRDLLTVLFTGFYPRIHDKGLAPRDWLGSYYQTYLERDVRNVLQVGDIEAFGRFVRLCAGRNGQLLNLSGLAADCGITHATARRWLSVLEASFLVFLLRPHHRNFGKRLVKTPKLYFLDTGLLCFLLQVKSPEELFQHGARGSIFESFVIAELAKHFMHRGEQPPLYFWRDSAGHEIDVLLDFGARQVPLEIKSARTVAADFFAGLRFWKEISGQTNQPCGLIYGGESASRREGVAVYPWYSL